MRKLAVAALLIAQPAQAHCFSVWNYPTPQHCGSKIMAHRASEDKSWYVEITSVPPEKPIPLPAVEPVPPTAEPDTPAEIDQRTPEQIKDQLDHDAAVETRKIDINKLMIILHAVVGDQ
jgi:hypothetical protein